MKICKGSYWNNFPAGWDTGGGGGGSSFFSSNWANVGAITNDTIDINLIKMFMDGPDVSLKGSPTVSPVTETLCGSDFL